ncbi:Imm53 family immunity protein [Amycolatopsis sp. NPDC054798]
MALGESFQFLLDWYAEQCDEEWEHEFGVKLSTLDSPGWLLEVDLEYTDLAGRRMERSDFEGDAGRWAQCWSDGEKFHGACDPASFELVLAQFKAFAGQPG